jgi:hypothetical protein
MSQQGSNYFRQGDQALVIGGDILPSTETKASAIADISVTGTYATDDTPIETAINSILAVMRDLGMIEES